MATRSPYDESPNADDVEALLTHFRLAAYGTPRPDRPTRPFPGVFGGYVQRTRCDSIGDERARLAAAVYQAAVAADEEPDRRALAAVGWHYGLFGVPRRWPDVQVPDRRGDATSVTDRSARQGRRRAMALLADHLLADPADVPAGAHYPRSTARLDDLDLAATLGALAIDADTSLTARLTDLGRDLPRLLAGDGDATTTLPSEKAAPALALLGGRRAHSPIVPLPPHDLDDLDRLDGDDRRLADNAHRLEPLTPDDVAHLVEAADRRWADPNGPDTHAARLCQAAALRQIAMHLANGPDPDGVWAHLERRTLASAIQHLRAVEHPAAFALGRHFLDRTVDHLDATVACAIDLSIVASGHGWFRLGEQHLHEQLDAARRAGNTEWVQQITLATSGLRMRRLRTRPVRANRLLDSTFALATQAATIARKADMPDGWLVASRRRQLEIVTTAIDHLGLDVPHDVLATTDQILMGDRDRAAAVDPAWDLQQHKASLGYELARSRNEAAAHTLELICDRHWSLLDRHPRWILDLWEARVRLEEHAPAALSTVHLDLPDLPDLGPYAPARHQARTERIRQATR